MRSYVINKNFQQCCMMLMHSTTHSTQHTAQHSTSDRMRSTCAVVSCITRLLSCHAMPYPVLSCPVLLCSVLFTPAPSFRTRNCTFVILPSLLLTAVALLHCTILTPSLSIHSSPLLCSATYSTHIFSANMTCMNQC
jgi:hypothetical protein